MDDLDPQIKDDEEIDGDLKVPKDTEETSLDELADEEEDVLPEDRFDDTEPEDLW